MSFTYVNTFAGIPAGTIVTTANSGGVSGHAFSSVTVGTGATADADSTHVIHGAVALQIASASTSAASHVNWTISDSSVTQYYRLYCYLTALPAASTFLLFLGQGGTRCARLGITTTGTIIFQNAAGSTILTTTTAVTPGQWFRLEGYMTGNASTGQMQVQLFTSPDSASPAETQTSSAAQNTLGAATAAQFGLVGALANSGPFWVADLGLSSAGYLGPYAQAPSALLAYPF